MARWFAWQTHSPNVFALRIPLTNDQSEFDQQILSLARVIIDSLNEEELAKLILKDTGDKGITKLEKYFQTHQLHDYEIHIRFLRNLQDLRDGAAHRKGEKYQRGSKFFKLEEMHLSVAFDKILNFSIFLLDYLCIEFLEKNGSSQNSVVTYP